MSRERFASIASEPEEEKVVWQYPTVDGTVVERMPLRGTNAVNASQIASGEE